MGSALVVAAVKYGLLALLWLFVVMAFRTVRSDLYGSKVVRTPAAAAPAAPRATAPSGPRRGRSTARRLVVTEGALAGTTIKLGEGPVTLGRADDSTLVLTDDYASTRHARLVPSESGWMVEDLGSTNGTYVGSVRITQPTTIGLGIQVRIGKTILELRK